MSLSQRFDKADDKRRSGGQTNKNVSVKIDTRGKSPNTPKNGMKKSNQSPKQQKNVKNAQRPNKTAKPARKVAPKHVRQKAKTSEDLDLELDTYMLGKDKAMSSKLDAEMDAYHASRAAEAESAPES